MLPADGTYFGSGRFESYDGEESYQTAWRIIKTTGTVEIAQLVSTGGAPFQVLRGIVNPAGLFVGVSDDPGFCEVIVLESVGEQLATDMFVAYGPPTMTCPDPFDLANRYRTLGRDPVALESGLRDAYDWGPNVVVGSVATGGWAAD